MMYRRPAISKAIDPRTEATKVANSAAAINGLSQLMMLGKTETRAAFAMAAGSNPTAR